MEKFAKHPIHEIIKLINENNNLADAIFTYSVVEYDYKTRIYSRDTRDIKGGNISIVWLDKEINNLRQNWNLAFHTKLIHQDRILHIPFIDFNVPEFNGKVQDIIRYRISRQDSLLKYIHVIAQTKIYSSGRSFHGYSNVLLDEQSWKEFTISMILLNYIKDIDTYSLIVDERWIAHRLLEGFGSLRWSCNSDNYLQYPMIHLNDFMI